MGTTVGALEAMSCKADIFVLTETWVPHAAMPPPIAGYRSFGLSRPYQHPNAKHASGGVALYVKDSLSALLSVWKSASDGSMLWVKLDSQLGLQKDLYICVAYVCPEKSIFYDQPCALDAFDELTNDIAGIQQLLMLANSILATHECMYRLSDTHIVPRVFCQHMPWQGSSS